VSEGIDFPDGMCRSVILVGIPYPNVKDPFIIEKKNHLDNLANRGPNRSLSLKGDEWYMMGTIRTINQALGRVIRHARDYGTVFFVDSRYGEPKFRKELPSWITNSLDVI
jgi:regulator of telomere elongation helicase 1